MNIYDIANRANVSIATVSRVINDSPKVSEKTRKKVHDIMEELGYTPNVFARGLGLNTMKTIGILCSDPSDLYVARALSYFEKMLRENGYDSLLCCSGYDTKNLKKYINILISKSVDAVIMIIMLQKQVQICYIIPAKEICSFFTIPHLNLPKENWTGLYRDVKS